MAFRWARTSKLPMTTSTSFCRWLLLENTTSYTLISPSTSSVSVSRVAVVGRESVVRVRYLRIPSTRIRIIHESKTWKPWILENIFILPMLLLLPVVRWCDWRMSEALDRVRRTIGSWLGIYDNHVCNCCRNILRMHESGNVNLMKFIDREHMLIGRSDQGRKQLDSSIIPTR